MRTNDRVSGIITVIFSLTVVLGSRGLTNLPKQEYGAGTFPAVVGGLLLILGSLLFLRGLRSKVKLVAWTSPVPIKQFSFGLMMIIGSISAYIFLTPVIGFPIISSILLSNLLYWFYCRNLKTSILIGVFSTALIWGGFGYLLQVPLDLGILEEVIY